MGSGKGTLFGVLWLQELQWGGCFLNGIYQLCKIIAENYGANEGHHLEGVNLEFHIPSESLWPICLV